jgi:hypothetical protein
MKNGGCDKTQEMVDEATRNLNKWLYSEDSTPSQIFGMMDQEQGVQGGPLGEDDGTVWKPHKFIKGGHMLHAKGLFGADRPIMYHSRVKAELIARKHGGTVGRSVPGHYHIFKQVPVKEDLDGTGGTEAAGFQAFGGSEDKTKQVQTIKNVVRAKYKRKLNP